MDDVVADVVGSACFCRDSSEAIDISKYGDPHVHCPCEKCQGKATWRMTAWRHMRPNDRVSTSDIAKKSLCNVSEDPELDLHSDGDFEEMEVYSVDNFCDNTLPSPSPVSSVVPGNDDSSQHESVARHDNDCNEEHTDDSVRIEAFIRDAVLRLLEMKEKLSCSEKHFEELLEWGKQLHIDGNTEATEAQMHWPNSWNDVQTFLSTIGFIKPKQYWICLRSVHPCHYGLMESRDELCPHCGMRGNIPYCYLSLTEKVKMWCSCPEMCKKMSVHWSEKEHWLPDEMRQGWGWNLKKELWDGTRFAELSYFWNPNATWILPVRCPFEGCDNVVSAEQIMESPSSNGTNRVVTCKECGASFDHCPSEVKGDPRNIALCGKNLLKYYNYIL